MTSFSLLGGDIWCIFFPLFLQWLNNCVGKKNYRKFFTLMVSALLLVRKSVDFIAALIFQSFNFYQIVKYWNVCSFLLQLILQWSTGIVVLICCFLDHKRFSVDIATKLGSSFSLVPYVIVVVRISLYLNSEVNHITSEIKLLWDLLTFKGKQTNSEEIMFFVFQCDGFT